MRPIFAASIRIARETSTPHDAQRLFPYFSFAPQPRHNLSAWGVEIDGKTVADQELRQRIIEFGVRKTARVTKTDSKTVMLISRGEREKPSTHAKVREFFSKGENRSHALQRSRT
jgi:hypothetical protein